MAERSNFDQFISNAGNASRPVLEEKFVPVKMEKGQYVFFEGDEPSFLYFIESGVIESNIVHGDGKLHIFHFDFPGDFIGEGVLYDQIAMPFSAQIRKDAQLYKISKKDLLPVIDKDPAFKEVLLKTLGQKLDSSYMKAHCIAGEKVEKRVMCALLRAIDQNGLNLHCGMRLDSPLTNRDISGLIGSTEESVSRIMSRLKREGIITTEKKNLIVLDRDTLIQRLLEE
ncbi:MAG: Crp/Fnr family transcriptional regulator [Actinobacteria bacterium]|nr:Crp/Fnr family transcriptional regulator [Actinomycetota bacterium]